MSCDVFANSNEISCKKGSNKVIAKFPDVCLSPPSPPAGPVPVPYPNTSFSKDMQNGSKTVKIKSGEVMLKDKSFYKTAPLGDEAATNGLGANVITHCITGKTYFAAWSMDVKFEGENVDRHLDPTTSNHMSQGPGDPTPSPSTGAMAVAEASADDPCKNVDCKKLNEDIEHLKNLIRIGRRTVEQHEGRFGRGRLGRPGGSVPQVDAIRNRLARQEAELREKEALQKRCCGG